MKCWNSWLEDACCRKFVLGSQANVQKKRKSYISRYSQLNTDIHYKQYTLG